MRRRPDTLFSQNFRPQSFMLSTSRRKPSIRPGIFLSENGFSSQLHDGTIDIICDSHINMSEYVNEPVSVIIFNLGYLPGGDRSITTCVSDTLKSSRRRCSPSEKRRPDMYYHVSWPRGRQTRKGISPFLCIGLSILKVSLCI